MEIVFTDGKSELILEKKITGFYGDVLDLIKMGIDIKGIDYDDEWTVKKFLNGMRLKYNKRIDYVFRYLELDTKILKVKIKELSKTDFKFVLLAKLLLNNKNTIIFDYFDIGLSYSDKKRLMRIVRAMKHDGKAILVISKDLVFLNQVVDSIIVVKNEKIVYNGKINELLNLDLVEDEEIIKFIKLANTKKANLDMTLDSKELLKDIYRSVY